MYARLAVQAPPDVRDRIHFLSVAAQVMRQILIDHARTKYAQKRGGRQEKLSLDEAQEVCLETPAIMVRIDDALNELARQDARKAKLIEMRFFGGLTAEESSPAPPGRFTRRAGAVSSIRGASGGPGGSTSP